MSTNINSTEQIVEINAGDQITNVNIVSQSTTQVISGEQVVTVDVNAGTIPAAWGSITGTLSNQTDLQNALNAKQNNITLTTTGTTGVATLVGATLNIPNYVSSTKQTEWDSAYNDKINSAEVSGTTTKTLTLTQQDGGIIQASWSDFDTAPVTSVFGRTGDVIATEGDYNINQLGDVTITSATNGQVLKYNGTAWVNAADASGLTSVGLAMPSAFTVSGSPLTSNGTITVTGAGTTSQYVRGDGSLAAFPSVSNEAKTLIREVYNKTGATLTKGTVIYIDGGQGNLPTVTKAIATGDPTSAQTFGIVQSDITNMNNGFVVVAGGIDNLDTQAYTEGTALYLSPTTAGAWTSTKPYAPDHMVYLGVVVRSHPTQGVIEVKIQNGVELDEIHNVSARFPVNKDGLFYNSTSGVWENKSIEGVLGYTPVPETRIITINGTAQNLSADRTWNVGTVTSVAASGGTGISVAGSPVTGSGTITITNTAPDQIVSLTGAGTTSISGTYPNFTVTSNDQYVGTVTSVNATVPTGFEVSGVPITSSGTVDIKFASGYSLPTNAKQTQWDDAYAKRIDSLTVTGNSGSATLTSNVLNVPTYTLTGLGGEPAITAGTTLQYWRGDKSFQTLDTSVVPENGNVYFTEPRVRATVLSGLNITGGSISASDSVLNAFGKVQNQINGLIGGSIFQSTWNASTNTPSLASGVGTKGYYYIVSVAGTTNLDGITDWQIGDWAIFDGTVWRKVDNTDAVVSVNGYTGVVNLVLDDLADVSAASPTDTQLLRYNGTTSKWYNWTPTFEPALTKGNLTEATSSVLTITGGSNAVIGSGTTIQVKQSSATGSGFLSSTDWTTFNNKQNALTNPVTGTGVDTRLAIWSGTNSITNNVNLTFDGVTLSVNGRYRTGGSTTNIVKFTSGGSPVTDTFNTVISDGTGFRSAYFRGNSTTGASVWWGALDSNGDNIPLGAIDANYTDGGLSFWRNAGGVGGGAWTKIFSYNGDGVKLDVVSALGTAANSFIVSDSGLLKTRTATQVRSDIGAAAASDLSNYLPLAGGTLTGNLTGTTALFNNRIGIGASSAIYSLQLGTVGSLNNSIRLGTYAVAKNTRQYIGYTRDDDGLFETSSSGNTPSTVYTGISGIRIVNTEGTVNNANSDNSIQLITHIYDGASRIALHASYNGRVGINGVTSPAQALDVDGSIRQSGVTSSMLKTNASGDLVAAVAGTDYQAVLTNPVTGTGTNNQIAYFNSTGSTIASLSTATYPSLTELSYVKGVTSAIQTQLDGKQATGNYVTTDTTQSITGQKTFSKQAAIFSGTTQSVLIDGGAGDGALTLNSSTNGYAYVTFAQNQVAKFEIGIVGTSGNGSLYINKTAQTGETGASIYIKRADGNVGILNTNPENPLDVTGNIRAIKNQNALTRISVVNTTAGASSYVETSYVTDASGNGSIGKYSTTTTAFKIINSSDTFIYNGGSGDIAIINNFGTGAIKFAAGGSSTSHFTISSAGASTFFGQTKITTGVTQPFILNGSTHQYLYIESNASSEAMTQYYNPTAGSWYTGIRTSAGIADTASYHIYSSTYGADVFALRTDGTAFFAADLFSNGIFRTRGTSNVVKWSSGTQNATFGTVLGHGTPANRTAFFRGQNSSNAASVWWGYADANGDNVPLAAADSDATNGGLSFWHNGGGTGGGSWTKILTYNLSGLTIDNGRLGIGATSNTYALQLGTTGSLTNSIRLGTYQVAKNTRQYIGYTRDDSGLFESSGSGDSPSTVLAGVSGIRFVNTEGTVSSANADNSIQFLTHTYNGGSRITMHINHNGHVGILNTAPAQPFHVSGRAIINDTAATFNGSVQTLWVGSTSGDGAMTLCSSSTGYAYLNFAQNQVVKFEIGIVGTSGNGSLYINKTPQTGETGASIYIKKSDGYVGINNVTNPTYPLHVSGNVGASAYFETSDKRLKSNIQDYNSTDILNVSAKIYEKDGKVEVGYLAQDLESVLKSAVSIRENGYLDLSYRQVHTAKIAALESEIKQLKNKLNELGR